MLIATAPSAILSPDWVHYHWHTYWHVYYLCWDISAVVDLLCIPVLVYCRDLLCSAKYRWAARSSIK